MPARVTRARARRTDENQPLQVLKSKAVTNTTKPARTPLADRTNSASDENTSGHDERKKVGEVEVPMRPRRAQRVPIRLADHEIAFTPPRHTNASSEKVKVTPEEKKTSPSPFKTPNGDSSIVAARLRRSQRLPSRLSDHSLSPSQFVELKPAWASTPLPPKQKVTASKTRSTRILSKDKPKDKRADSNNNRQRKELESAPVTKLPGKLSSALRSPRKPPAKPLTLITSPKKAPAQPKALIASPRKTRARVAKNYGESSINQNSSIFQTNRKESAEIKKKLAIYEFTFDPSEEPDVSKKKRKKQTVRRKAAPRRVVIKDNYSKNVAKQLESLKGMISKKSASCTVATQTIVGNPESKSCGSTLMPGNTEHTASIAQPITASAVSMKAASSNTATTIINKNPSEKSEKTTLQIRNTEQITNVEPQVSSDRAIPPPPDEEYHDDIPISYSPVSTPFHVPEAMDYASTSMEPVYAASSNPAQKKDPLNLIEELSFFDDVPVASSSLMSVRKSVGASPWRVDCNVHSKWPVNMYVKPNMTPAYERSFTNFDVEYALRNMDKPVNTALFTDREADGLKQTSILSFISEVARKKAPKTPTKSNSMFDGSYSSNSHTSADHPEISPVNTPEKCSKVANNESPASTRGIESPERKSPTPDKDSSHKEDVGVSKCFGFDDSEDRENVSPRKPFPKFVGDQILRTRITLKELNQQKPMRLDSVPAKAFAPTSAVVNELYEKIKLAQDNPVAPESESMEEKSVDGEKSSESNEANIEGDKEQSQSPVALFEDVEIVHHDKPIRKSYVKTRKVAFQQTASTVMNETEATATSDDEDNMTFAVPKVKGRRAPKRKKKKVQEMSEKESEEAKAWVAGFNSMIEAAEEFDLVVE